jgi:O-antigen/teichoic acid export membrane protein
VAAFAGILAVIALSGVLTTNLALAAAVFFALQSVMAPTWAAASAAAAALLLAPILIAVVYWLSKRARRNAARAAAESNAAKAESAMLMGAIASAFVSGVVSGMDRRPTADKRG